MLGMQFPLTPKLGCGRAAACSVAGVSPDANSEARAARQRSTMASGEETS